MTDNTTLSPLTFPCENYLIKVVGKAGDEYREVVIDIVKTHAPEVVEAQITEVMSRNGRFCSLNMRITATGEQQIQMICSELIALEHVHMVI